jgi:hypothetical protein
MYCSNCGQKIEDHLGKNCLFSRESSLLLKSFILTTFLTLSKFNKNYQTYPIEELYNIFAELQNLPTSKDLQEMYFGEEDWQDLIFLSIDNLGFDKVFHGLILGEFQESNHEWFQYNDDSTFADFQIDNSDLQSLTMKEVRLKNNKFFWEVISG